METRKLLNARVWRLGGKDHDANHHHKRELKVISIQKGIKERKTFGIFGFFFVARSGWGQGRKLKLKLTGKWARYGGRKSQSRVRMRHIALRSVSWVILLIGLEKNIYNHIVENEKKKK